ncbi:MAG: thiamine pyrophosphate-dependent enzyme, partial [Chloroflexota bacterium]
MAVLEEPIQGTLELENYIDGEWVESEGDMKEVINPASAKVIARKGDVCMELTREQQLEMLRQMYLIRAFEEKADELYSLGRIHGFTHLSIGQEAVPVGAMACLRPDDYILSTHRGHGHCIARGADPQLMMAEFMGKETGY